jgi:UDP-2-acetamido-3-amino-2,3-dideoxy-glucuronate N-acetyltransferase
MRLVNIHPSAIIDEGAVIGKETKIWHFSHLMPHCKIGERCIIGQNVFIDNHVLIGKGVKIQNNVSLYNGVIVEDDVFIGPSAVFTNVINPRSFIERKQEFKTTTIRQGATIGANVTIICGIEIGSYAFIGAGAVVTKNVKPFSLVYGNPAEQKGWMSRMGYALDFNSKGEAVCSASGEQYLLKKDHVIFLPPFKN